MGEIFSAEKPAESLEFTGERLTSSASGQIEIEHFHRYFLARAQCRGKDVLDIASGEGYGSAFLAQVARSVVGVEIAPAIATHAARAYRRRNLRFVVGDARAIPLPAAAVDVVVSFETIEHLFEQEAFVAEVKRVLRPGGLFIVSTPERDVFSPYNSPANPFHCRELTREEFRRVLGAAFASVQLMDQRPMLGSAMLLDGAAADERMTALTFERRGDSHFEACDGLPRNLYVIAFASDAAVAVPATSLYIETSHIDLRDRQCARQAQQAAERLTEQQARNHAEAISAVETEAAAAKAQTARLAAELSGERAQAHRLEQDLAELRATLEAVYASTSWRMLRPAHRLGRRFPWLARFTRRSIKLVWWTLTLQLGTRLSQFRAARRGGRTELSPQEPPDPLLQAPPDLPIPVPAATLGNGCSPPATTANPASVLGTDLVMTTHNAVIGIVTYDNSASQLKRLLSSAEISLRQADLATDGRIFVTDNGTPSDAITAGNVAVRRLPSLGNLGFGASHNRLMQAAFDAGADVYIAANPDGMFHPDAVSALLREIAATDGDALVEALQFPEEHPKVYDPATLDTPWASGACLGITRKIFEAIGGFDESFFLYCEDVDLSWRARAAGFSVKVCPLALFLHPVTNRPPTVESVRRFRESGIVLARKWGDPNFERFLAEELRKSGASPPHSRPLAVPEKWLPVADFSHLFHFAPTRW
ncbi:MAG TPA: methyltransferase domain-containing protein [Stellaceae bacterium]|nr:methyltransferase domain-containing protein [Stellaceae bacterium]